MQKKSLLMRVLSGVVCAIFLQSCAIIGYGTSPDSWDAKANTKVYDQKLYYSIGDFSGLTFGGYDELRSILHENRVFAQSERVSTPPTKGTYLQVNTKHRDPSAGCLVWGYVSVAFIFLLPAYCGSSGFYVQYHIYKDGQEKKMYEYEIRRKAFAWLPMIAFVWVNLITSSEEDAFRAVTNQFFQDAIKDQAF